MTSLCACRWQTVGPGFVDVLHAVLGGELAPVTVTGPYGTATPATVLLVGERTAYVECAQAVGLHLAEPEDRDPERANTLGLGQVLGRPRDGGRQDRRRARWLRDQRRRCRDAGRSWRHCGGWPLDAGHRGWPSSPRSSSGPSRRSSRASSW